MTATASDIDYLKVLEKGPFDPIGWLYTSVYETLASHGWCFRGVGGFQLSEAGRKVLQDNG